MLPAREKLTIGFAHAAYRLQDRFHARGADISHFEVRDWAALEARIAEADVLVVSGLWRNELLASAPRLKFIQSISAGVDQYDKALLAARGVRLASAGGVNARAVAEHAIALLLAMARRLPEARDNQHKRHWRGMIGDLAEREDELGGKTMVLVGTGRIGGHIAHLARAFGMKVLGVRRDPAQGTNGCDAIHPMSALPGLAAQADCLVLACALTPETTGVVNAAVLAGLKRSAWLVNVARGRVIDEPALVAALQARGLAGAALDVTAEEPLPQDSPLWTLPNVFITPHTAGETRAYEDNVLDILMENLERLGRGESTLRNQIV